MYQGHMVLEVYVTFQKAVITACLKVLNSVSGQHFEDSASYCRASWFLVYVLSCLMSLKDLFYSVLSTSSDHDWT